MQTLRKFDKVLGADMQFHELVWFLCIEAFRGLGDVRRGRGKSGEAAGAPASADTLAEPTCGLDYRTT